MIIVESVAAHGDAQDSVPRTTRVGRCEAVQTNVRWPIPVDQRLNELLERLTDVGGSATRSELLAALVVHATPEGAGLQEAVTAYRLQRAGDVVLTAGPILKAQRRPGRRPR